MFTNGSPAVFARHAAGFVLHTLPACWDDALLMLQTLDFLDRHAARLARAAPTALPHAFPLLVRAATWNPHVVGDPLVDLLPALVGKTPSSP